MIRTPEGFEPRIDVELTDEAFAHVFVGDELLHQTHRTQPLTWSEYRGLGLRVARVQSIGLLAGAAHVAVGVEPEPRLADLPDGWRRAGLRSWFGALDDTALAVSMRAVQLLEWDRTHTHCGACGTLTERVGRERARRCPACGLIAYPRIAPAMMVLVTRGQRLLLARGVNFPPGRYSALAGFLEAGETIEEAIMREVREEVGIEVGPPQYFGSQSWPFPNSLMIAFTAPYAAGELNPDPAEIADAQWFELDALPQLPPRLSIARALIDSTIARLRP
jgi:NAD+ diphosphatase